MNNEVAVLPPLHRFQGIMRWRICRCQSYNVAICRSASNSANRILMTSRSAPAFSQRTPSQLPGPEIPFLTALPASKRKKTHSIRKKKAGSGIQYAGVKSGRP